MKSSHRFIGSLLLDVQGQAVQGENWCRDWLTLLAKALLAFKASRSVYPTTQRNNSESCIVVISDVRTSRLATLGRTVLAGHVMHGCAANLHESIRVIFQWQCRWLGFPIAHHHCHFFQDLYGLYFHTCRRDSKEMPASVPSWNISQEYRHICVVLCRVVLRQ
jgi:hypothetical protein